MQDHQVCVKFCRTFGGFGPFTLSSKNYVKWHNFEFLASQVMLVSRGSSEGGGGFATKKVKINTRLTAAPAASITYNFRSPLNK